MNVRQATQLPALRTAKRLQNATWPFDRFLIAPTLGTRTMNENTEFTLSRDVEVIQIPSGNKTTIPAGTPGVITQTLGGSYTIATYQGLARVAEKDLDALGLDKSAAPNDKRIATNTADGPVEEKQVWDQLRHCYDPEI